ncbi:squalene synthase isoform X3 [Alosa sapidissima]|uniref:squalene synthase isoform X3 n=1 Tax=Alosa sapidissima TaxID=34773 RepID=UPI001C08D796|nr:squalene synthase isoform X3 [Alosa sapidissima]
MAGACCKCSTSLSVFKRSLSVTSRGSGPASRPIHTWGRLGERGVHEGCLAARPSALKAASSYRHPVFLCFSYQESMSESLRTCYVYLNQTSRSFAAVIQALDGELRHAVCIFYLVLRALDTVEDDMSIPLERKVPMLTGFHSFLYQPDWSFSDSQEKDRQVLQDFPTAWSKFASRLEDFAEPHQLTAGLGCLNMLVTDALRHVPDVISYLERLRNQSVFNFCAIPQVMAIATLSACYNNPMVFQGVVKIRKGQAVTLMMQATNMGAVKGIIAQYSQEMLQKVCVSDPSCERTLHVLSVIRERTLCEDSLASRAPHLSPVYLSAAMLLAALSWQYLSATATASAPPGSTDMQGH